MINSVFYLFLKGLTYCPEFFGYIEKRLHKKVKFKKVNFKSHGITNWNTKNYNKHISRYLKSKSNQAMKFGKLKEYNLRNIFLQISRRKWGREASSRHLLVFQKRKAISG